MVNSSYSSCTSLILSTKCPLIESLCLILISTRPRLVLVEDTSESYGFYSGPVGVLVK